MYCVPECLSEGLVDLPESGMGYQLVRVESKADARRFVVLNAEWAIAAGTDWQLVEDADIRLLGNHDHTRGPRVRVHRPVDRMNAPAAIREAETFPYTLGELKVERHGSFPAISGDDVFYRYSAFANDRRLRSEAGVIPAGTYLTSHRDTQFAESGLGAVARYALPNPAPAIFRFAIGVPTGTVLMCGTASPSFGQSGGGVELRTDEAIDVARVYDPEILPEW